MNDPRTTPSPYSVSGLRGLAKRRGYTLHKVRRQDRYYLEDEYGAVTVAREHCPNPDDCWFKRDELHEFLRSENA